VGFLLTSLSFEVGGGTSEVVKLMIFPVKSSIVMVKTVISCGDFCSVRLAKPSLKDLADFGKADGNKE